MDENHGENPQHGAATSPCKSQASKIEESVEDLDDLLCLEKAKLRNAGKPSIAWDIVAKELGLRPPRKKRLGS